MPARVVVVLDEPGFAERAADLLNADGYEAIAFADSMAAVNQLEQAARIELLITCPDFAPGKPNGVSLALMTRQRRPGLKVLFIGPDDMARVAYGVGEYLPSPLSVEQVAQHAKRILAASGGTP
jgi:DNA-binding NtrC family response regulator